MNRVQKAFNDYQQHKEAFKNADVVNMSQTEITKFLADDITKIRNVWACVWIETRKINPSLIHDIRKGHFDRGFTSGDLCYLDKNWQIFEEGTKCPHCHHIAES